MPTDINWFEVCQERAAANAQRAIRQGIEVHTLTTTIGRVKVTFEGSEHGRLTGALWTDAPVRVNSKDWRISARYQYLVSTGHWENGKRITHDPPLPCATFPGSDMMRAGNHRATSNANSKAELAIGAAIATLDHDTGGVLRAHAALNERELLAQEQGHHAQRARERAAEWIAQAERHERNAAALRAGHTPTDYELTERRVW